MVGYLFIGSGAGMLNTPLTSAAMSGLPRERTGVAGAVTSTFRQVGNAVGVALLGSLALAQIPPLQRSRFSDPQALAAPARRALDQAFTHGLQDAYWAACVIAIVSLGIAVLSFSEPDSAALPPN